MARRNVVVMPGDGIGQVVLPEALRVLEAAGFEHDNFFPPKPGLIQQRQGNKGGFPCTGWGL